MEDTEIIELITKRMEANQKKAREVKQGTFVNIPAIYAQAYEYLLLEIEDEMEKSYGYDA